MPSSDPFAVLELTPTLDAAQVKRAYFAQLQKHPPHADPEGFRRLRAAYEALAVPGALPLAVLAAPLDVAAELDAWHRQWDAPMRLASDAVRRAREEGQAVASFVTTISRLRLDEAVAMFEVPQG